MNLPRSARSALMSLALVTLLGISAACGSGEDDTSADSAASDTVATEMQTSDSESSAGNATDNEGPVPDPIPVDVDDLEMIDRWEVAGVPNFQNGEELDFEGHASQIENGGTLLIDGGNATASEIIGFYRGALEALGWEERVVREREITANNDIVSLHIIVDARDQGTHIMMILTDNHMAN